MKLFSFLISKEDLRICLIEILFSENKITRSLHYINKKKVKESSTITMSFLVELKIFVFLLINYW